MKNSASTFVSQMTTASLTAVLTLFLVRGLGAKQYGVFALTLGMSSIAVALSDLGLSDSTSRFVAEHRGRAAGLGALVADALKLKVVVTGLLCALFAALASVIAGAYGNPELVWPLRGIALATLGQSTYALLLGVSTSLGRAAVNIRLVAAESLIEVSASVALVLLGTGAAGAAFGRAIGFVAGAAIAAYVVLRLSGHERGGFWRLPRRETVRRVGGYAGPMFAIDVSYTFSGSLTVLLVGAYVGSAASGMYTAPMKLITLIQYVGLSIGNGVAPRLARGDGQAPDVTALNGALRGLIGFQCLALAPAIIWAGPITHLLLGSGYAGSADVLRALAPYIFFSGLVPLVTGSVSYLGEAGRRVPIAVATLALIAGCGVILIPSHGLVGAAVATDIAFGFYTLAHLWLCRRLLELRLGMLIWSLASGLTAAGAMGIVLATIGTTHLTVFDWFKGGAGGLAAFIAMMIFTREIRGAHIMRVAKRTRGLLGRLSFVSRPRSASELSVLAQQTSTASARGIVLPQSEAASTGQASASNTRAESPDFAGAAASTQMELDAPAVEALPTEGSAPQSGERLKGAGRGGRGARGGFLRRRRDRSRAARPAAVSPPGYASRREGRRSPAARPPGWVEGLVAQTTAQRETITPKSPAPVGWLSDDVGENPVSRGDPPGRAPTASSPASSSNSHERVAPALADVGSTGPASSTSALAAQETASPRDIVYQIAWRLDDGAGVFELRPVDPSDARAPATEQSQSFPWSWRMAPAPILEARRAHDALVDRLLVAGWRRAGLGDAWFAHRFRLPNRVRSDEVRHP